jgi:hypothetical protein
MSLIKVWAAGFGMAVALWAAFALAVVSGR